MQSFSHRSYLDNSQHVIDQMYESGTEYIYNYPEIIIEDDEKLNSYNPLVYALFTKHFTLEYDVKVGYI